MIQPNRSVRAPLAALALVLAAACGRDDAARTSDVPATDPSVTAQTSPGTVTPTVGDEIDIEGLKLGRGVGTDNRLTDETDDFRPGDAIYAVVETDDNEANKQLVARWTYGPDNQVVAEQTQTVAAGSEARTVFKLEKASPWPKGEYHLRILHNGREVKAADFEVK